ncbi:MAG: SulP family sulfate permease [Myxococcota bacterium]|jgi:SulP family sulfate permease
MPPRIPIADLRGLRPSDLARDAAAAAAVTVLGIPQGIAYAMIAGLPPAMGLYASIAPTIIGSLARSSRHVITGPTNALSLLVGGAIAAMSDDPATVAITLALLVGVMQTLAGFLRLGVVVDYISSPVVRGYITGAGVLIGAGQLHNITRTVKPDGGGGTLFATIRGWIDVVQGGVHLPSLGLALAMIGLIVAIRWLRSSWPSEIIAMVLSIVATVALGLREHGVLTIADIAPIPSGLPPLTIPDPALVVTLLPVAVACTVLSLVESSSVARAIASRTGQRLDASAEFAGQGLANIAAAFTGGYPTSGSLSRSAINEQAGGRTRLSGVMAGLMTVVVVLLLSPTLNNTPIAGLAGLLLVVAWDLVDVPRIRKVMATRYADQAAFLATLIGTWVLDLDKAIYLGVGISLVLFLQRARMLVIREMAFGPRGRLRDLVGRIPSQFRRCGRMRILHAEGALFFGSSGELRDALDEAASEEGVEVVLIRLKRTQGMDVTTIEALEAVAVAMRQRGQRLVLAGLRARPMERIERSGAIEILGETNIFPTRLRWFQAMDDAIRDIQQHVTPCEGGCEDCPMLDYLADVDEKEASRDQ